MPKAAYTQRPAGKQQPPAACQLREWPSPAFVAFSRLSFVVLGGGALVFVKNKIKTRGVTEREGFLGFLRKVLAAGVAGVPNGGA